ncbi:MAG: insulinase family protein [Cellvibrionaceae bacterium]|nr:insulinase family protein [Cellvibrionaceae bacterium]
MPLKSSIATIIVACLLLLSAQLLGAQAFSQASEPTTADNQHHAKQGPFANIESWRYPNGLQVYFKAMPKTELVTFRMSIPVGGWQDPDKRTGLAHFTEHMLFTGSKGYSKAEFEKLVDDRGGQNNASTTVKRTDYWLELPESEWAFGLDWFGQLLFNHQFESKHVDEERRAVILERDLKPETPADLLRKWFISPDWAREEDQWTQVLGLEIPYKSLIGTWDDVNAIQATDIQAFYDRYYGPQNMTIMLAGNFPRDKVKAYIDEHFANIEPHGEYIQTIRAAKPVARERRHFSFSERRGHVHEWRHYISDVDKQDMQWLWFLRTILHHDLNTELRQNRQAAYGVNVSFNLIQGHGRLISNGNFDPAQEAEAFAYINSVYQQLQNGTMPKEQFETLRKKVLDAIVLDHQTPWSISNWVASVFYDKNLIGESFPDLYQFAKQATQADLANWMEANIKAEHSVVQSIRPNPTWPLVNIAIFVLAIIFSFSVGRRFLITPLELRQQLYIRKVLYGPVTSLIALLLFFCATFLLLQALAYSSQYIERFVISSVDSYWLNITWTIFTISIATIVILNIPARVPRKIILAEDHWRVKCLSFRSSCYNYSDISFVEERYLLSVIFSRKAFPCRLFHFNPFSKGLLIGVGRSSYLLKTRNNRELIEEFEKRRRPARPVTSTELGLDIDRSAA